MHELRQGLIQALQSRHRSSTTAALQTTMLEVALMAGVNDRPEDAAELATFVHGITAAVPTAKVMVNLIPYNPGSQSSSSSSFQRPSFLTVRAFQRRLWDAGVYTHVRTTRGDDESAACGQLVTETRRKGTNAAQP